MALLSLRSSILGLAVWMGASSALVAQSPPNSKPATGVPATTVSQQNAVNPSVNPGGTHGEMEHLALSHLIESIDPYRPARELKGSAILAGSTTMQALGKHWADRFRQFHPEVSFARGVDGTDAAIKALGDDPSIIAGVSRPLSDADLKLLKSKKAKDPLGVIVALDPLALYVHKNNPIVGVTPEQLESIYHAPGGSNKHSAKWKDLGVMGELADKPIRIHGRSDVSGTQTFIKQLVIRGGELAPEAASHASNTDVCKAVGSDVAGVGMCGFGDANELVRAVPLILNGTRVEANEQSFLSGQYPLVRPLMIVVDKSKLTTDGGLREAMLRYILSRDGQLEAVRAGFFPVDPAYIRQQLESISGPQLR